VPADVEAWCAALLDDCSERRAFDYWLRVNRFYDWLLWHPDHPHVYNPVLMAAASGGAAAAVWAYKRGRIGSGDGLTERSRHD
jgi:hypothetical protein